MPRLRKLRDLEWEPTDEDFPEARHNDNRVASSDGEADATDSHLYEGYESSNGERASGASWLSNAAIIASIPDHKLQASLRRYRGIIRLLEAEIHLRGITPRRSHNQNASFDAEARLEMSAVRSVRRQQRRRARASKQVKLDTAKLLQALAMLDALHKAKTR